MVLIDTLTTEIDACGVQYFVDRSASWIMRAFSCSWLHVSVWRRLGTSSDVTIGARETRVFVSLREGSI